jgi:hypothetical protein
VIGVSRRSLPERPSLAWVVLRGNSVRALDACLSSQYWWCSPANTVAFLIGEPCDSWCR